MSQDLSLANIKNFQTCSLDDLDEISKYQKSIPCFDSDTVEVRALSAQLPEFSLLTSCEGSKWHYLLLKEPMWPVCSALWPSYGLKVAHCGNVTS